MAQNIRTTRLNSLVDAHDERLDALDAQMCDAEGNISLLSDLAREQAAQTTAIWWLLIAYFVSRFIVAVAD